MVSPIVLKIFKRVVQSELEDKLLKRKNEQNFKKKKNSLYNVKNSTFNVSF